MVLDAIRRHLHRRFDFEVASTADAGLVTLGNAGPFAVVVAGHRLPTLDGARFLATVRAVAPLASRVMLAEAVDAPAVSMAINEAAIHRMITLPVRPADLGEALDAAVERHRTVSAEQMLIEAEGAVVDTLVEIVALANPRAGERARRLQSLVGALSERLELTDRGTIEAAALLSQVGAVALTAETENRLARGEMPTLSEAKVLRALPAVADEILGRLPMLDEVRRIIRHHHRDVDDGQSADSVPFGARVLRVACEYDAALVTGCTEYAAVGQLLQRSESYDRSVLDALKQVVLGEGQSEPTSVTVDELTVGMTVLEPVVTANGLKLVQRGAEMTPTMLRRIRRYAEVGDGLIEPIAVRVTSTPTIEPADRQAAVG